VTTEIAYESILTDDSGVTASSLAPNIDVVQNGIFFENTSNTGIVLAELGTVKIAEQTVVGAYDATSINDVFDDGRAALIDASTAETFADIFSDSIVVLEGNFTAIEAVEFAADDACDQTPAESVTVTQAIRDAGSIELDLNNDTVASDGLFDGKVCVTVDGETVIEESDYTVTWTGTANTGYVDKTVTGELSSLSRNGSRAEINMLLDPNSDFRNFVRITNPSSIDGRVFLELINDDGVSESFNLNDIVVNGTAQPASIAGGASTRLIPMSAIVNAAGVATVSSARNKFRLVVDGEFGETGETSGVRLENVTLATDNSTFSTF
jgi:hypothetical protein